MVDEAGLIAAFYEAAFDASRFPGALRRLAEFTESVGGVLLLWDKYAAEPALLTNGGHMGADASDAYRRHYAQIDPYRPLVEILAPNRWVRCNDFFDDAYVAKSAFYNEYLGPRGTRYMASARIVADAQFDAFVGIHRGRTDEPFAPAVIERVARIGRHLGRAVEVYLEVTRTGLGRTTAAAMPEQLTTPAVLVDGGARVLFANPAAEALLARETTLGIRYGRLSAVRGGDERQLASLIGVAVTTGAGGTMVIHRSAEQAPLEVLVTPAGPVSTLYNLAPTTAALVLLRDRMVAATAGLGLRERFDLTNSEAALAQGLLDGKRLTDIAAGRRVSIETVRTQLRSLFKKTGTARQVDLLRVLLTPPDSNERG